MENEQATVCDICQSDNCPDIDTPGKCWTVDEYDYVRWGVTRDPERAEREIDETFGTGGVLGGGATVADAVIALEVGGSWHAGNDEVQRLLGAGHTFHEVAAMVGYPLSEIVRRVVRWTDVDIVLEAEKLLRSGATGADVRSQTGMKKSAVYRLAATLGITMDDKRTPEKRAQLVAQAEALRAEGKSFAQVAEVMGLRNRDAAIQLLRPKRVRSSGPKAQPKAQRPQAVPSTGGAACPWGVVNGVDIVYQESWFRDEHFDEMASA